MPSRDIRTEQQEPAEEESPQDKTQLNPLLLDIDEETQKVLVQVVLDDYQNGIAARTATDWGTNKHGEGIAFDDKYAELLELYEGEDVSRPEKWMCGRSLKIAQAVVEMLVARLVPGVWNENIHRWRGVEWSDKQRVERVNKIMHWVLNVWMDFGDKVVPMYVRQGAMLGTIVAETMWSVTKRDLDEVEEVPVLDELGQPMMDEGGSEMTIESRLLRVDERPEVALVPLTRFITQPGCTDIQKEPIIKVEDFYYHELVQMQNEGLAQNVTETLKTKLSKTKVTSPEEVLEEAERIRVQDSKIRNHIVESLIWYGPFDVDQDGFAEEICVMIAKDEEVFLRAFKTSKISRRGKRPFNLIPFLQRLNKLMGIGVLEQIKPLAYEVDACFRQLQDANTLSIMRWGFYDPNSDYNPEEHVAKPRAMYPVTNPSQNVYFPDVNIPTERLLNAIRLVLEFIERLTAASSYMLGKESEIVGGSGTATRTQAIVSSAEIRFNMPASNLRTGLANILTDIFDMCFMNMPDGLERRIVGEDGELVFDSSEEVQDAFANEMDAYLAPNPSFGDANTERELAVLLYDKFVMGGNPLIVGDMGRVWHATANIFKSYGEDPTSWIGKPPSRKQTNDPEQEHTFFRQGEFLSAEPQENHLEHLMVHQRFMQGLESTPDVLLWPREALEALRQHIQEHMQMMQMIMSFQSQGKKGVNQNEGRPGTPAKGETGASQGGVAAAPGQFGTSSSASASTTSPTQQVQGTTSGSSQVR